MKVLYLPLDSRPCNYRFPVQLLNMAGHDCLVPAPDQMDYFRKPSHHAAIREFLLENAAHADALILSVDQLAYGSLLASRDTHVSTKEALDRLQLVRTLRQAYPSLLIVAYGVILRSSISTLRTQDIAWHNLITEYSQAAHRAALSALPQDQAELQRITALLPQEMRDAYHQVRERNHTVNRHCIDFLREGTFDRLLLLQEDSQPLGFHRMEQDALRARMADVSGTGKIALHNGTDEGGCLCAASLAQRPLKLYVETLGRPSYNFVAKYEDRPFDENIRSSCAFAGIELTTWDEADKVLLVLPPDTEPQQDVLAADTSYSVADAMRDGRLVDQVADMLRRGKPVGLLDVRYANGGAMRFMETLAHRCDVLSLSAYAAWNTASNALGTILAQLQLGQDGQANQAFTLERLLDDLIYQSRVRSQLRTALAALGEDVLSLKDKQRAEQHLNTLMEQAVQSSPLFRERQIQARYALPWPRIFEASVTAGGRPL